MADPFVRMTQRLFSRLGEEALLRAAEPVRVILSRGVAIVGENGLLVAYRDTADLPAAAAPRIGDSLQIGSNAFLVDSIDINDGYSVRCILREGSMAP